MAWLLVKGVPYVVKWDHLPIIASVNLVQRHNEGSLFVSDQLETFQGLLLQAVHEVDHQNGNIAQVRSSRSQVGERLVTWCINNLESWD